MLSALFVLVVGMMFFAAVGLTAWERGFTWQMAYKEIMEMLEEIRSEYINWIQNIEADGKTLDEWSMKTMLLDAAIIIVNKEKERNQQ